jgi:hypothetical protein
MKNYLALILVLGLSAGHAQAATIDFSCLSITSKCIDNANLFSLEVSDTGSKKSPGTSFLLSVGNGTDTAIDGIYFDDRNGLLDPTLYEFDFSGGTKAGGGVEFDPFKVPGRTMPRGSRVSFNSDFSSLATPPRGNDKNGVDNGEWLGITFFDTTTSLILAALGTGDLRIGINTRSLAQLVSNPPAMPTVVPLPAAVWLFGSALIGLLGISAGRRKTPGAACAA